MSSTSLFAFVEGRLDRPFFDRIFAEVGGSRGLKHQVIAMKELPGATGGKSVLLSTFQTFRRQGILKSVAFGKSMVCIFLADKDADDYSRRKLRSAHLIYSPSYDLEGHLFTCGNLQRALADSCGITLQQARNLIPSPEAWLANAAETWKDWISLCLISQHWKVNCGCTFERVSAINVDPLAPPDAAKLEAFKIALTAALKITRNRFEQIYSTAYKRVEGSLQAGKPMKYFKGKWLSFLMQKFLESKPRPADADFNGVGERLGVTLVAQVAVRAPCKCSDPYASEVDALVAHL
jgi:hypothetical protein